MGELEVFLKDGIITLKVGGVIVWTGTHGEWSRSISRPK